jgi:Domain of unknown function (DUF1906)
VHRHRLLDFRSRAATGLAVALLFASSPVTIALAAGVTPASSHHDISACSRTPSGPCSVSAANGLDVSLPTGLVSCPGSGFGAACTSAESSNVLGNGGTASLPAGQAQCTWTISDPAFNTPATCSDQTPLHGKAKSVSLALGADRSSVQSGQNIVLTARSSSPITDPNVAIEIYDKGTGGLLGACSQGSQCAVAFAATGGLHNFQAFIARPTAMVPPRASVSSNVVSATWVGVRVDATVGAVVGPGKSLTVTATSTVSVDNTKNALQIYDEMSRRRLTYCSHGTTCSVSVSQQTSGPRWIIGAVGALSESLPSSQNAALSQPVQVTWLAVSISGHTSGPVGDQIYLHAHVNADVKSSPWSIGILDEHGQLVAAPCKSGTECTAAVTLTSPNIPHFMAAIGGQAQPDAGNKLIQLLQPVLRTGVAQFADIQARSGLVEPTHLLWGVDSCKSFAQDAIGNGLYLGTAGALGWPDFWGRYLTDTVCPGITGEEVATAHRNHIGILPIYNDYVCSDVVGYVTGVQYAWAAVGAAQRLGIPPGRALAIDIEPPGDACPGAGNVDVPFIRGWFDGVATASYVPAFYGNGTPGSEFAAAWCGAVAARPDIAIKAFLWSFQPSLLGDFTRASAPGFGPEDPGCGGNLAAWQYQIGGVSNFPDVDQDEITSVLPLWYP